MDSRVRWQFTLQELMIGTALFSAVLGFAKWKGPLGAAGVLIATSVILLGLFFLLRHKRLAVYSGICFLLCLIVVGLYRFAPCADLCQLCPICGKQREIKTYLGVTWSDKEVDTDLSDWCRHMGFSPHEHQWTMLCATEQSWGGGWVHLDWFGFEVAGLHRLKEVSEKLDRATLDDLVNDYRAAQQDRTKLKAFWEKIDRLAPEKQ
jgi:hypothetical protein